MNFPGGQCLHTGPLVTPGRAHPLVFTSTVSQLPAATTKWGEIMSSRLNLATRHDNSVVASQCLENEVSLWKRESLRNYPAADLSGKIVLVRCDLSVTIIDESDVNVEHIIHSIPTISHLIRNGARILLCSHWHAFHRIGGLTDAEFIAGSLSQHLKKEVCVSDTVVGHAVEKKIEHLCNGDVLLLGNLQLHKEEVANDKHFSKALTEKVDILVNDAFSVSHRVLASTVGAACFTGATLAGFEFERELFFITKAINAPEYPFVAIACPVGGSRVSQIIGVLHNLLDKCSTIVIAGSMLYTFFNAIGHLCPSDFIEKDFVSDVLCFLKSAMTKKVDVVLPVDFTCVKEGHVYKTFRAADLSAGWDTIGLGESTLENIRIALQTAKMAMWVGPLSMSVKGVDPQVSERVAKMFVDISESGCITIVGGKEAASAVRKVEKSESVSLISRGSAALLTALKGVSLPAVSALDLECCYVPEWAQIYREVDLPLFVDIGSGNGVFIVQMGKAYEKSLNFLGLEIRKKLVDHSLVSAQCQDLQNVHFINANATTAYKKIVSRYPGRVAFVAIQCPDPNFTNNFCRRRIVQKQLIEAIVQTISKDGKIFLQSDVKSVAEQLRQEFLDQGKGRLHVCPGDHDAEGWLLHNPFQVMSDWESHALQRNKRMFRVLLSGV